MGGGEGGGGGTGGGGGGRRCECVHMAVDTHDHYYDDNMIQYSRSDIAFRLPTACCALIIAASADDFNQNE